MQQEKKKTRRSLLPLIVLAAVIVITVFSSISSRALLFQGVQVEEVSVKALDGAKLRCIVYKPLQPAGRLPAVIVVHGLGASSDTMNALSTELARNGVLVLALNYRGHDGSEGGVSYIGDPVAAPNISNDLVAALEYLYTRDDVDQKRIGVIGYSMGSRAALRLGILIPSVNPVVMIGPYFSWEISAVNTTRPKNLLIVVGENDIITPPSLAQLLFGYATSSSGKPFEVFGSPKEGTGRKLVIVPRADHYALVLSKQTIEEVVAWVLLCMGLGKPTYYLDPSIVASTAVSASFLTLIGALCLAYLFGKRFKPAKPGEEHVKALSAKKAVLLLVLLLFAAYYAVSTFAAFPLIVDWGWRVYSFAAFSGAQYTFYYFLFLAIALLVAVAACSVLVKGFLSRLKESLSRNLKSGLIVTAVIMLYTYATYNIALTGLTANYAMTPLRFILMIYLLLLLLPLIFIDEVSLRLIVQENIPLRRWWGRWLAAAAAQYLLRIIPLAWWVALAANPLATGKALEYYISAGLISLENAEVVKAFLPMNAYGLYYAFSSVELLHATLASYVYEEYRNPLVTAFLRAITAAFMMAAVMAIL